LSRTRGRPGAPDTRAAILTSARQKFANRGYEATSLPSVVADAKVDPALVVHYFGTKERLFVAATGLPAGLAELFASLAALSLHHYVRVLVRGYPEVVDSDKSRNPILALVRPAVSNDKAAAMLRGFLIGIATLRHVLRVEPLAGARPDEIVALVTPAIAQNLLWSATQSGITRCGQAAVLCTQQSRPRHIPVAPPIAAEPGQEDCVGKQDIMRRSSSAGAIDRRSCGDPRRHRRGTEPGTGRQTDTTAAPAMNRER
jgi:AcrR family transcriptional regulator